MQTWAMTCDAGGTQICQERSWKSDESPFRLSGIFPSPRCSQPRWFSGPLLCKCQTPVRWEQADGTGNGHTALRWSHCPLSLQIEFVTGTKKGTTTNATATTTTTASTAVAGRGRSSSPSTASGTPDRAGASWVCLKRSVPRLGLAMFSWMRA